MDSPDDCYRARLAQDAAPGAGIFTGRGYGQCADPGPAVPIGGDGFDAAGAESLVLPLRRPRLSPVPEHREDVVRRGSRSAKLLSLPPRRLNTGQMRFRFATAPVAAQATIVGLIFGVWAAVVFSFLQGPMVTRSVGNALIGECVTAVVVGVLALPACRRVRVRDRDRAEDTSRGLSTKARRAAKRASMRGPIPTDPLIRQTALDLARYRIGLVALHRWVLISAVLLIGLPLLWSATSSPWWLTVTAPSLYSTIRQLLIPRRVQHRIEALTSADGSGT